MLTHNVLFCYKRAWVWTRLLEARQRCCFKKHCLYMKMDNMRAPHMWDQNFWMAVGLWCWSWTPPPQWYQEGHGPKWKFILHTNFAPKCHSTVGSSKDTSVSSSVCFDSWTFHTFGRMGIWVRPQYCSSTTRSLLRGFWHKMAAFF